MARRLDPDIREFANLMQERRNEAAGRVAKGEILHLNFMDRLELERSATANLGKALDGGGMEHAADAANYVLAAQATRTAEE